MSSTRAGSVVSETLLPILREGAGLEVTVHETKRRGHAAEVVSGLDLSTTDLIVLVGGDGTVYEGLQVSGGFV
jgi:sphingosine kinase